MKWFFDMLRNERGEVGPKKDDDKDKDKDKDKDDEVIDPALDEDHQDDETTEDDDDITIDLDEDDETPKEDKKWAEMRVENKELKKTVDEMKAKIDGISQPAPVVTPVAGTPDPTDPANWTDAEWDELAKNDWKKAVDLRSEIKAKQQYQTATATTEHNKVLEDSKVEVLRRHPELGDTNSEKSKIFRNIVTANPEYVTDRKGPMHAMYEMEHYMEKNMGVKREDIVKAEKKGQEQESQRRDTVALTSTAGRNMTEGNKIILSKDEQEFCKLQEIDPKTYAANKKKLADTGGRGGIQL